MSRIAIIGAGPSGLVCAGALARLDCDVVRGQSVVKKAAAPGAELFANGRSLICRRLYVSRFPP